MFSTYFYILILGLQSIYAESNFRYNQEVKLINKLMDAHEYAAAYEGIYKLEIKGIFNNNDLARVKRNLALKIHRNSPEYKIRSRTLNEFVIQSLSFYQHKQFLKSLSFTTQVIVDEPIVSDSMIKVFEIIASQAPSKKINTTKFNQLSVRKNIRINEAMNLLDLMKRREKTLF